MLPLDFILFLQIIIFLFITPGTPRIVIVSYSMNYGVQKCIWTALGDVTANFTQATLVIFVLGTFFSDNPNFLNIFKWIGVIYLFFVFGSGGIITDWSTLYFLSLGEFTLLSEFSLGIEGAIIKSFSILIISLVVLS